MFPEHDLDIWLYGGCPAVWTETSTENALKPHWKRHHDLMFLFLATRFGFSCCYLCLLLVLLLPPSHGACCLFLYIWLLSKLLDSFSFLVGLKLAWKTMPRTCDLHASCACLSILVDSPSTSQRNEKYLPIQYKSSRILPEHDHGTLTPDQQRKPPQTLREIVS